MTENTPKRIVVVLDDGMARIMGVTAAGQPAEFVQAEASGLGVAVNLVASKPRYWLYKPVMSARWTCFCGFLNEGNAALCVSCLRGRGDK